MDDVAYYFIYLNLIYVSDFGKNFLDILVSKPKFPYVITSTILRTLT